MFVPTRTAIAKKFLEVLNKLETEHRNRPGYRCSSLLRELVVMAPTCNRARIERVLDDPQVQTVTTSIPFALNDEFNKAHFADFMASILTTSLVATEPTIDLVPVAVEFTILPHSAGLFVTTWAHIPAKD